MIFPEIEPTRTLAALEIVPLQIRNFRLVYPSKQDIRWMQQILGRESRKFGLGIELGPKGKLTASWERAT